MIKVKDGIDYWRQHPRLRAMVTVGVVFGLLFVVCWKKLDPDFGWHLAAGSYFRAHGIPAQDIFTYTAHNFPWIDHEWGNDVIVSFVYGLGGYNLLAVLYAALWTGALLLSGLRGRLFILLAATAAVIPFVGIRPLAWTVFLLAILLKVLGAKRTNLYWPLPLLFVVWANLHAGFIAGLAVIAYFAVRERRARLAILFTVCVAATLLNPYGPRLYQEVGRTMFDGQLHSQIVEWARFHIPIASWPFLVIWAAGFWVQRSKKLSYWFDLAPLMLLAALSASRNVPLFVVAGAGPAGTNLQRMMHKIPKRIDKPRRLILVTLQLALVVSVLTALWLEYRPWQPRDSLFPVRAVAYLRANPCEGNLFNDYNYGGYIIWKLPSEPVYIDGRMPSWRDSGGQKYLNRYFAILNNPNASNREFDRYNIRCALLSETAGDTALAKRLESGGWQAALRANGAVLLLASDGQR